MEKENLSTPHREGRKPSELGTPSRRVPFAGIPESHANLGSIYSGPVRILSTEKNSMKCASRTPAGKAKSTAPTYMKTTEAFRNSVAATASPSRAVKSPAVASKPVKPSPVTSSTNTPKRATPKSKARSSASPSKQQRSGGKSSQALQQEAVRRLTYGNTSESPSRGAPHKKSPVSKPVSASSSAPSVSIPRSSYYPLPPPPNAIDISSIHGMSSPLDSSQVFCETSNTSDITMTTFASPQKQSHRHTPSPILHHAESEDSAVPAQHRPASSMISLEDISIVEPNSFNSIASPRSLRSLSMWTVETTTTSRYAIPTPRLAADDSCSSASSTTPSVLNTAMIRGDSIIYDIMSVTTTATAPCSLDVDVPFPATDLTINTSDSIVMSSSAENSQIPEEDNERDVEPVACVLHDSQLPPPPRRSASTSPRSRISQEVFQPVKI